MQGYSRLYQKEIHVPTEVREGIESERLQLTYIQHFICTQEQRKRATSTSRERRIDIYAALSEVSIIAECIHIIVLITSSLRLYAVLLSIHT